MTEPLDVSYHPLVERDLRDILAWYDSKSTTAGNRFYAEFESVVAKIRTRPTCGFLVDATVRKILFRKFPYALAYEVSGEQIFIFVVKHQRRHPGFGMKRRRP